MIFIRNIFIFDIGTIAHPKTGETSKTLNSLFSQFLWIINVPQIYNKNNTHDPWKNFKANDSSKRQLKFFHNSLDASLKTFFSKHHGLKKVIEDFFNDNSSSSSSSSSSGDNNTNVLIDIDSNNNNKNDNNNSNINNNNKNDNNNSNINNNNKNDNNNSNINNNNKNDNNNSTINNNNKEKEKAKPQDRKMLYLNRRFSLTNNITKKGAKKTPYQIQELTNLFENLDKIEKNKKKQIVAKLSKRINLSPNDINVWLAKQKYRLKNTKSKPKSTSKSKSKSKGKAADPETPTHHPPLQPPAQTSSLPEYIILSTGAAKAPKKVSSSDYLECAIVQKAIEERSSQLQSFTSNFPQKPMALKFIKQFSITNEDGRKLMRLSKSKSKPIMKIVLNSRVTLLIESEDPSKEIQIPALNTSLKQFAKFVEGIPIPLIFFDFNILYNRGWQNIKSYSQD